MGVMVITVACSDLGIDHDRARLVAWQMVRLRRGTRVRCCGARLIQPFTEEDATSEMARLVN